MEENAPTVSAAMHETISTNVVKIRRVSIGSLESPIDSVVPNISFLEPKFLSICLLVVKYDL